MAAGLMSMEPTTSSMMCKSRLLLLVMWLLAGVWAEDPVFANRGRLLSEQLSRSVLVLTAECYPVTRSPV